MLTPVPKLQYGTPIFIIPKKEGTARLITYYQNPNHNIFRNSYPLPRIVETMQKIEGFHYDMELDLTMGYYTIELLTKSCKLTPIVTEFRKF